MGRNNKKYRKDLHQQAYERLTSMQAFGESKLQAKQDGTASEKIFSYKTYETYWRHTKYYLKWLRKHHPECTTLKHAKRHVNEWLQTRVDAGLSAWTIHTELAALNKLFGIPPDDPNRFQAPERRRENIRRSRNDVPRDRHFSVSNNLNLIKFVQGTGTRRNVLERLRGDDLWTRKRMQKTLAELESKKALSPSESRLLQNLSEALTLYPEHPYFLHHRKDKGGKFRFAPIIGPNTAEIVERMRSTPPGELVWQHVHDAADIHGYRGDYGTALYKQYARDISKIPYDRINKGSGKRFQSQVYWCRKDEKHKGLDKAAMFKVSKALGHSRLNVIADHYLRDI